MVIRKVKWTQTAAQDLQDIAKYIAKGSEFYAKVFVEEIRLAAKSLSQFSHRGPVVSEVSNPNIRELFVKKYRLIYQVNDGDVIIVAVVHQARDLSEFMS